MLETDLSKFTEKHIKLSQALINRHKEIEYPCVAKNMLNSSPTDAIEGSDDVVSYFHLSPANLDLALSVILSPLNYAHISEKRLVYP